jgi:hypothetical protein
MSNVGDPSVEILRAAESLETDIIVAGYRGLRGMKGTMGNVSRNILTHTTMPVLIGKRAADKSGLSKIAIEARNIVAVFLIRESLPFVIRRRKVKNLFAVGDDAGITRGLVQASISGIIAVREIVRRLSNSVEQPSNRHDV